MVNRASAYLRERIIRLNRTNSYRKIQAILLDEEFKISLPSICNICSKYKKENMIVDRFRAPKHKKIKGEALDYLDMLISNNREIKVADIIHKIYIKFQIIVSPSTIYRAAKEIMWIKRSTRYCQIVSETNSIKRYMYSCFCLLKNMRFDDCIFIDETKIELEVHAAKRYCLFKFIGSKLNLI